MAECQRQREHFPVGEMINKTQIENNLTQINALYQKYMGYKEALYYSKLAILEVCGWIEESIDDVVLGCVNKQLTETKNLEFVEEVINQTYSFEYERHFRHLLIQILGIINVEKLENNLEPIKFELMKSSLGTLRKYRNIHAHTYTKGVTKTMYAPSSTMNHFKYVYQGLKDVESCIRKMII